MMIPNFMFDGVNAAIILPLMVIGVLYSVHVRSALRDQSKDLHRDV